MTSQVFVIKDETVKVIDGFEKLKGRAVYVGIPSSTAERPGERLNSAAIGYTQEFGSPATNLPARPFLIPGVRSVQTEVIELFKRAAKEAISGSDKIDVYLHQAGNVAVSAVKKTITSNIPPPLSPVTIANRYKRRKTKTRRPEEEQYLRAIALGTPRGAAQSAAGIIALINTAKMLNSITYVIKKT